MIEIVCPVHACQLVLTRGTRQWTCPAGHNFDVARGGYCNLLQPNERRSKRPGDSAEAAKARRRLFERGIGRRFLDEIASLAAEEGAEGPILDAGCGEGFHLAGLCDRLGLPGVGIDISTPSIDLAARAYPGQIWIVSNVDRRIPLASGSIGTLLSITSRVNRAEFSRVLRKGGLLLVATPGRDDLVELRERVLGHGASLSKLPDIDPEATDFELVRQIESREVIEADRATMLDLLVSTYRGQRASQSGSADGLTAMSITQSREISLYRLRD